MSPSLAPVGRRSPYGRHRDDGAHAARAAPLPAGRGGTCRAPGPAHGAGDADRRRARRPRHRPPRRQHPDPAASPTVGRGGAARVERQRVPRRGRHPSRDPHAHAPRVRRRTARARRGDRPPRRRTTLERGPAGLGPATAPPSRGPDAGYEIDQAARSFLLAGDESALPAIGMLLDAAAQHGRGGGVHRGRRSLGTSGAQDTPWRGRDLVRPRNRGPAGRGDRERRDRRRRSRPTSGCGPPARRRRCNGCVATSSTSAGCLGRRSWCGVTGSRVAKATRPTSRTSDTTTHRRAWEAPPPRYGPDRTRLLEPIST